MNKFKKGDIIQYLNYKSFRWLIIDINFQNQWYVLYDLGDPAMFNSNAHMGSDWEKYYTIISKIFREDDE